MRDASDLTRLRPSLPHVAGLAADPNTGVGLTTARERRLRDDTRRL
jgi:hypothetical protein